MKKEDLAKQLNISRKTLYNYMQELNIHDLDADAVQTITDFAKKKGKSKETSKAVLLQELEELKKQNLELTAQNSKLQEQQDALYSQVEWYKNEVSSELKELKLGMENITKLLPYKEEQDPKLEETKKEKNSFWSKLFKK